MGRRPQVKSCQAEGLSYEKCNQVRSIIAVQKSRSRRCVVPSYSLGPTSPGSHSVRFWEPVKSSCG